MPLLILFIVLPLLELAVLIQVGGEIGALWTIALIGLTALVGVQLIRWQGFATLLRANERIREGTVPAREIAEGVMLALAGALLIAPGFITDAFGFALLIPTLRIALAEAAIKKWRPVSVVVRTEREVYGAEVIDPMKIERREHRGTQDGDVIDGEFRRER